MKGNNERKESAAGSFIRRYCNNKLAVAGFFVLLTIALIVILVPPFLPFSEAEIDALAFNAPPGGKHILGGDDVGRDVLSRLLYGGRVSLFVGIISTAVSVVIGIPLGMIAAFYRGVFEIIVMRLSDIFMSFPATILILFLVSMFGPSIITVTVVIGVLGWPKFARQISWGNMLYNAQSITILTSRPWMWVPPGLALVITILSINFIGNGMRDALDPKTKI